MLPHEFLTPNMIRCYYKILCKIERFQRNLDAGRNHDNSLGIIANVVSVKMSAMILIKN